MFKLMPKYIESCGQCPFSYYVEGDVFKDLHCKLLSKRRLTNPEYYIDDRCPLDDAEAQDE